MMEYSDARVDIQSGDLLAWSGHSFFSRLIKLFTESSITHVGIAYKLGKRLFVLEAMEGRGVRIFPLSRRVPFFWIRPSVRTHEWNTIVEDAALERIGEKYSFKECARAVFKKRLKRDAYWQCAEFASYMLSLIGYPANGYNIPHTLVQKMLDEGCCLIKVSKKK